MSELQLVPHPNSPNSGFAWDLLYLAGEITPGLPTVTVVAKRDLDEQKRKNHDGSDFKDKGYPGAEVSISIRLVRQEDYDQFKTLVPKLHPRKPGAPRAPLAIAHPATNLLNIHAIQVKQVSIGAPSRGVLTVNITAREWIAKPQPVKTTKPGSTGSKTESYDSTDRFGNTYYDNGDDTFSARKEGKDVARDLDDEDVFDDLVIDGAEAES